MSDFKDFIAKQIKLDDSKVRGIDFIAPPVHIDESKVKGIDFIAEQVHIKGKEETLIEEFLHKHSVNALQHFLFVHDTDKGLVHEIHDSIKEINEDIKVDGMPIGKFPIGIIEFSVSGDWTQRIDPIGNYEVSGYDEYEFDNGDKIKFKMKTYIISEIEYRHEERTTYFKGYDYGSKLSVKYDDTKYKLPMTFGQFVERFYNDHGFEVANIDDLFMKDYQLKALPAYETDMLALQVARDIAKLSLSLQFVNEYDQVVIKNVEDLGQNNTKDLPKVFNFKAFRERPNNFKQHGINTLTLGLQRDVDSENVSKSDKSMVSKDGTVELRLDDIPFVYNEKLKREVIDKMFNKIKGFKYNAFESETGAFIIGFGERFIQVEQGNSGETYPVTALEYNVTKKGSMMTVHSAESKSEQETKMRWEDFSEKKRTEIMVDKANQEIKAIVEYQELNDDNIANIQNAITINKNGIEQLSNRATQHDQQIKEQSGRLDIAYDKIESNVKETAKVKDRVGKNEKTLINHETQIKQTAKDINIQAEKLEDIGGTNLLKDSDTGINSGSKYFEWAKKPTPRKYITLSVHTKYYDAQNDSKGRRRIGMEFLLEYEDGEKIYMGAWSQPNVGATFDGRVQKTYFIKDKKIKKINSVGIYVQLSATYAWVGNPQVEFGKVATGWSESSYQLAEKDKVISYINVSPEKIKIKSNKIELEGHTTINGGFKIDTKGNMIARNADIQGKVTASSGRIGGWEISHMISNGLAWNEPNSFMMSAFSGHDYFLRSTNNSGAKVFEVKKSGRLYATDVDIKGKITADSGKIGGWSIKSDRLETSDKDGSIAISTSLSRKRISVKDSSGTENFGVNRYGIMNAKGANVEGRIVAKAGKIANWNIDTNIWSRNGSNHTTLKSGGNVAFAAGSPGHADTTGAKLQIFHSGKLVAQNADVKGKVTATSGKVGGWIIGSTTLSATNKKVWLNSAGNVGYAFRVGGETNAASPFVVYKDGKIKATSAEIKGKVTATSGSFTGRVSAGSGNIGNYSISGGSLVGNNVRLHSNSIAIGGTTLSALGSVSLRLSGSLNMSQGHLTARSIEVTGSKNAIVPTRDGIRAIHAYETATAHFGDIGEVFVDGVEVVEIDPIFGDTIHLEDYHVFLSAYSDAHVWVENRTETSFEIHSNKPTHVSWEIKGIRRGYRDRRLEEVDMSYQEYGESVGDLEDDDMTEDELWELNRVYESAERNKPCKKRYKLTEPKGSPNKRIREGIPIPPKPVK